MSEDRIDEAFDAWWLYGSIPAFGSRKDDMIATWNASRARAIKEMREGMPPWQSEPIEAYERGWNRCRDLMSGELDRMEQA